MHVGDGSGQLLLPRLDIHGGAVGCTRPGCFWQFVQQRR